MQSLLQYFGLAEKNSNLFIFNSNVMIKFINKTLLFVVPFFVLYFFTLFFYKTPKTGDLLRLGYIPCINRDYRQHFKFTEEEKFTKLSSKPKEKNYKIMTIGDSFSEQEGWGYKRYLANDFTVLHVDRFFTEKEEPIQALINMSNSDFFNHYKVQYVILQNVERHFIDRVKKIDINGKTDVSKIDSMIVNHKNSLTNNEYKFFSRLTLEFPFYHFPRYFVDKNYLSNNKVYNFETNTKSLFSNNTNKLLFYYEDLSSTEQNNKLENAINLNNILNQLSRKLKEKNIKLIVLPSPDKYDLYYDCIVDKKTLTKPIFFDNFKKLNKAYIYIDSKEILSKKLNNQKDIYYFDDTHWSPIASELIAKKIKEEIK